MSRASRLGFIVLLAFGGCGGQTVASAPAPARGKLAQGIAATVGPDAVSVETVRRIAKAEGVTLLEARRRAIDDALFAAGARERFHGTGRVASVDNAVLARRLLEELKAKAEAQGPITDAEVARLTERHWYEFDRPASARTTHAVVVVKKPADDAPAKALAQRILAAVDGVHDPAEFKKRVEALPKGGLDVRVQNLFPVAADGRVVPDQRPLPGAKPETYDKKFAEAANAIKKVGAHSPVIHTRFGYHVILLDQRLPAKRVPLEERRKKLTAEAMDDRARNAENAILKRLRATTPVQVARALAALTSKVRIQR